MTSVGYGDVVPISVPEKIIALMCMIAGVAFLAYLIGAVTAIVKALNMSQTNMIIKKQRINEFLEDRKVHYFREALVPV